MKYKINGILILPSLFLTAGFVAREEVHPTGILCMYVFMYVCIYIHIHTHTHNKFHSIMKCKESVFHMYWCVLEQKYEYLNFRLGCFKSMLTNALACI